MMRGTIPIHSFADIAEQYSDTLLLGNGASIALSPSFTYGSLLEHARADGLITPNVQTLFDHFGTSDFELVLRMLRYTNSVNHALGVQDPVTGPAYDDIRQALIRAVSLPR